jgi:hypothetical protein
MNTTTTSVSFKPCVWEVHNGFDFYSCIRGYTLCTNPEWLFEDAKKTREKVNAYYGYNAYIMENGDVYVFDSLENEGRLIATIGNDQAELHPKKPHHQLHCNACFLAQNMEMRRRVFDKPSRPNVDPRVEFYTGPPLSDEAKCNK